MQEYYFAFGTFLLPDELSMLVTSKKVWDEEGRWEELDEDIADALYDYGLYDAIENIYETDNMEDFDNEAFIKYMADKGFTMILNPELGEH